MTMMGPAVGRQDRLFYEFNLEERIPHDHLLRRIDMVVVYKIDRLTRALTDFVRLVERFDAAGCSFVSVTQAFNTATSMGRLTLSVLLSFAQFEREVTPERIRRQNCRVEKEGAAGLRRRRAHPDGRP
jgi:site-specific DNA recombinase